jgi:flotillin
MNKENDYVNELKSNSGKITAGLIGIGLAGYALSRYKTSRSNEWLVRTGLGVNDIQIGKKFIQWPFQNIERIDMLPVSYKFTINAMSKEKMEFKFPTVFTVGPKNDNESLIKYSRYLLNQSPEHFDNLIEGIFEGESRTAASNLPIEDIFTGRTKFKNEIVEKVQEHIEQFGLEIYNANIEELKDSESSNYFTSLSQKIKSEAENRAKVEVAEQNKLGEVGSKEREGETRQKTSIIESDTALVENQRQQEILKSKAELERVRAEQDFIINQAKIKADNESLLTKMTMEKEVEVKRAFMELEKQRATDLSSTQVKAEMEAKKAEGEANSTKIKADAQLYYEQKNAEAKLYAKQKEADGINAVYSAQAEGFKKLVDSFGGNPQALISYTMMDKGIFEKLAESNAKAIQGLNPKITVWTHDASKGMEPIQNLAKSVVPMLDTIESQTGYKLPTWMMNKDEENKIKENKIKENKVVQDEIKKKMIVPTSH